MKLTLILVSIFLIAVSSYAAAVTVAFTTLQSKYGNLTHVYFETASGPGSSTPGPNTALASSGTSNSYPIAQSTSGYLWSPQFTGATTISAGNWVLDFWVAALNYIPITITNNQASATPNPFQEKVTWNPSTYASYEASNLGNIRFCSDRACNTSLFSWLESCTPSCSTSATSASAWLKLTSSIAPNGGTLNLYMVFLSQTTQFDVNFWGEAPNLSGTYGQYDNGANVFTFYDNFAGTTLSAKWSITTSGAGGTVVVNNGATFAAATGNDWVFVYSAVQTQPLVAEAYMVSTTGDNPMLGETTTVNVNGWVAMYNGYEIDWNPGAPQQEELCPQISTGAGACITLTVATFPAGIWSLYWAAAGNEGSVDGAGNVITSTDNSVGPIANYRIYLGTSNAFAANNVASWARMRAYPPGNVLPSTSFGSISSDRVGVSIYTTDSTGTIVATIASNVLSPVLGTSKTQYAMTFAGSQVTVPANGYISVVIAASVDTCTVYWGVGQPTNFQVPLRVLS